MKETAKAEVKASEEKGAKKKPSGSTSIIVRRVKIFCVVCFLLY